MARCSALAPVRYRYIPSGCVRSIKLIDPLYYLQVVFNQTSELISLDDVQRQIREQHDEQFGQFAVDRRVADKEEMQERLA